ncbi:MAG TPA: hypothetical protein VLV31_11125 [Candidatus Acidoferrales bacterium]|nr:hypothetical protein [Candidatus Acidoferrales bacterium]
MKKPISKGELRGRSKRIKGKARRTVGRLGKKKSWQLKGIFEQTEGRIGEEMARLERKARNLF